MESLSKLLGGAKKIVLTETEVAVKNYFENNAAKNAADKLAKQWRKKVDTFYKVGDNEKLENIGLHVNYKEQEKVVLDNDKLLEKLKDLELTDCIKTIEVVDENKVAEKILSKELDPNVLVECNKVILSSRLYIKKIK